MSNRSINYRVCPIQKRRRDVDHKSKDDVHHRKEDRKSQPLMCNDVVNTVSKRDAIYEWTMERLSYDAVDISIAAIGSQQIEILAEHRLDMLGAFLCKGNDRLSVLHRLDACKNILILLEQLDRQPAFGITPGIKIQFFESRQDVSNLTFDLAAVIEFEEFKRCNGHVAL